MLLTEYRKKRSLGLIFIRNQNECKAIHKKFVVSARAFTCKSNTFNETFRTRTRSQKEAKGNSEVTYRKLSLISPMGLRTEDQNKKLLKISCSSVDRTFYIGC